MFSLVNNVFEGHRMTFTMYICINQCPCMVVNVGCDVFNLFRGMSVSHIPLLHGVLVCSSHMCIYVCVCVFV